MRIFYLASHFYPIVDASTRRIHSYTKSFVEHGNDVMVIVSYPKNDNNEGVVDGIRYQCFTKSRYLSSGKIRRLLYRLMSIAKTFSYIKNCKPDVLMAYSDSFFVNLGYAFLAKQLGINFIVEKTEYPYGYNDMNNTSRYMALQKLKLYTKIVTISKELESYYKKTDRPVFLLPMTVDMTIFDKVVVEKCSPYIAVTFGVNLRDGLFDTIKVYEQYIGIRGERDKFQLVLIGDIERLCLLHPECNEIKEYIRNHSLEQYISFTGRVTSDQVCQYLANASCLLTTPTRYDSGGFPTKLGEYMLSGTPIVLTAAGEVSDYLENRVHALVSKPENMDEVSRNICFIQDNIEFGQILANNAKALAKKAFNADTYVDELLDFIIN